MSGSSINNRLAHDNVVKAQKGANKSVLCNRLTTTGVAIFNSNANVHQNVNVGTNVNVSDDIVMGYDLKDTAVNIILNNDDTADRQLRFQAAGVDHFAFEYQADNDIRLNDRLTGGQSIVWQSRAGLASASIGFFGSAAVVQQTAATDVTALTAAGAGAAILIDSEFTSAVGATAYTIQDILAALKTYGLLDA